MKGIICITGVSSGIGRACSEQLLESGYEVIGSVRKPQDSADLQLKYPERFHSLILDVTNQEHISNAESRISDILGGRTMTALINNAGIALPGPMSEMPQEDFRKQMEVNLFSIFNITNAFLPFLGKTLGDGPKGKIINISSVAGLFNSPFNGPYCISKHALESMSDIYRRELMMYKIPVVLIEPGPIKTNIFKKVMAIDFESKFKGTDYEFLIDKIQGILQKAEDDALPVKRITDVVFKILDSSSPKTRYLVYPKPLLFRLMTSLPDKLIDKLSYKAIMKGAGHRPW